MIAFTQKMVRGHWATADWITFRSRRPEIIKHLLKRGTSPAVRLSSSNLLEGVRRDVGREVQSLDQSSGSRGREITGARTETERGASGLSYQFDSKILREMPTGTEAVTRCAPHLIPSGQVFQIRGQITPQSILLENTL
jgi:hypothetical protein